MTNFLGHAVPVPAGEVMLASEPLGDDGLLPSDVTVWVKVGD